MPLFITVIDGVRQSGIEIGEKVKGERGKGNRRTTATSARRQKKKGSKAVPMKKFHHQVMKVGSFLFPVPRSLLTSQKEESLLPSFLTFFNGWIISAALH